MGRISGGTFAVLRAGGFVLPVHLCCYAPCCSCPLLSSRLLSSPLLSYLTRVLPRLPESFLRRSKTGPAVGPQHLRPGPGHRLRIFPQTCGEDAIQLPVRLQLGPGKCAGVAAGCAPQEITSPTGTYGFTTSNASVRSFISFRISSRTRMRTVIASPASQRFVSRRIVSSDRGALPS